MAILVCFPLKIYSRKCMNIEFNSSKFKIYQCDKLNWKTITFSENKLAT